MRKTKMEKGITLIALIITIVVLLILAAVAINSIKNDGILSKAEDAAKKYNQAVKNEQDILGEYEEHLSGSRPIAVGSYVEYDVSYTDMYSKTAYTSTNGWRYLGTDADGNKLIISTGIPLIYKSLYIQRDRFEKLDDIPYEQNESTTKDNTAIGSFEGTNGVIGNYFKSTTYGDKILNVRTLTLVELNKAINSATGGSREETDDRVTSDDLMLDGVAEGLLVVGGWYWLNSHPDESATFRYYVDHYGSISEEGYAGSGKGVRPVVVLSGDTALGDSDVDGVYEINM